MRREKAEKFIRIYNWCRLLFLIALLTFIYIGAAFAQESEDDRVYLLEEKMEKWLQKSRYAPQLHGILRGKYEYQPQMGASRFEVRNARISVSGKLPLASEYKAEIDLCDESQIKMKDAWVRITPTKNLRLTIGQQRMPFSIDAHRNPSAQYFANRSFIAKQVGNMRDVGFQIGYDFTGKDKRKILSLDAGVFNGSNLEGQKSAWFKSPGYSARIQYFPIKGLAVIPSVQHQKIADHKASYTSLDFGSYYEYRGWHIEAEYLHKFYAHDAFSDCNAVDAMLIYRQKLPFKKSLIEYVSYLGRYDYMGDHSSGKDGFETNYEGIASQRLVLTDAERHRMTAGLTFAVRNPYFPTHLRLNYEKYWYTHGGAKESEQDKIVCELMVAF